MLHFNEIEMGTVHLYIKPKVVVNASVKLRAFHVFILITCLIYKAKMIYVKHLVGVAK